MSDQPIRNSPQSYKQRYKSLLSIGGEMICNFTPILPYLQHWGDEPRPRFFSGEQIKWRAKKKGLHQKWNTFFPNSGEDQKKRSSPKMEHFFPEIKWRPALRCIPESNYWRGCRWRPYSNYWGDTVKLLGDISPHPPGFSTPGCKQGLKWMSLFHPYPIASYWDPTFAVENYFETPTTFML